MATAVIMPRQGNTVESCIVSKWHKKKGDKVSVGDILFTYETDKATFDEESEVEGILLEIYFEEGEDVDVLSNMCVIGEEGEDISSFAPEGVEQAPKAVEVSQEVEVKQTQAQPLVQQPVETQGILKISPRAKALAEKSGADIAYAKGSGPNGRIIEQDIQKLIQDGVLVTSAAKAAYESGSAYEATGIGGRVAVGDSKVQTAAPIVPTQAAYTDEKLTNIRKVIARTMHASLAQMAQLTLNSSFDASSILRYRAMIKNQGASLGLSNITLNDIIIFAAAKTLLAHPDLNAHFLEDTLRRYHTVNMGVAIDTERGLMVPTVFDAQNKTLNELALEIKDLAEMSKSGAINPDFLAGGTFTITNLGNLGVESFTPVINPPQTAILGVCGLNTQVKVVDGEIKPYQAMGLSLTIDHRVVDGAPAARFLKDLCTNLENFEITLAK